MRRYTYGCYDRDGFIVSIAVLAHSREEAGRKVRAIFDAAADTVDVDEGLFLNDEEEYNE